MLNSVGKPLISRVWMRQMEFDRNRRMQIKRSWQTCKKRPCKGMVRENTSESLTCHYSPLERNIWFLNRFGFSPLEPSESKTTIFTTWVKQMRKVVERFLVVFQDFPIRQTKKSVDGKCSKKTVCHVRPNKNSAVSLS